MAEPAIWESRHSFVDDGLIPFELQESRQYGSSNARPNDNDLCGSRHDVSWGCVDRKWEGTLNSPSSRFSAAVYIHLGYLETPGAVSVRDPQSESRLNTKLMHTCIYRPSHPPGPVAQRLVAPENETLIAGCSKPL
jgi:hypothetical protein